MHDPRMLLDLARTELAAGQTERARKLARAAARRGARAEARAVLLQVAQREEDWAALDRLLPAAPTDPRLLQLRWDTDRVLGRMEETYAAALALAAARPDDLDFVRRQAESYAGRGDAAAARRFVADARARHPDAPVLRRLDRALRVAQGDAGLAEELLAAPPADPAARAEVVADLLQLGRPGAAADLVAGAVHPRLRLWAARFALWAGDTAAARAHADGLAGTGAARVRAAADTLDGVPAVRALEAVVAADPADGTAWAWLAEALEAAGRYAEAEAAADRAMAAGGGFNLVARLTRYIAVSEGQRQGREELRSTGSEEVEPLLAPLGLRPGKLGVEDLRAARACFGGNRTAGLTTVRDGRLVHYPRPADPRDLAQAAQKLLVTRGPAAALEAQTALHARFPGHPLLHTYRGEVHLWMGDYGTAAGEFQASLAGDRHTKWAWIGLGASRLLQGDPQAALDTFAEGVGVTNFAGPTLWIYRAEALFRLGQRQAGLEALHTARDTKPKRLATWTWLALLAAEDGDPAPAAALCRLVEERLPGLALDVGPGTPVARMERWFRVWRGNRSSGLITWADAQGRTRAGMWDGVPPEVVATYPAALRGG